MKNVLKRENDSRRSKKPVLRPKINQKFMQMGFHPEIKKRAAEG